jgi:hypothetical protein
MNEMTHDAHAAPVAPPVPADVVGPGPDADNPALVFAKKTYLWTIIFAVGFVGSVLIFIL